LGSRDFEKIIEEHKQIVINICYRFTADAEESKDLAQEVFIEVYKSLSKFREESKLSTWIYRIAVNKSLDEIKKKNRKKRFAIFRELFNSEAVYASDKSDPHTILEERERKEMLQKSLDSLPAKQRTALTLSKIESFSSKEISKILKCSVPAVDMLIHRAKQNLKQKLIKQYEKLPIVLIPLVFIYNIVK